MTKRKPIGEWRYTLVRETELGEFRDIPGTGGVYKVSRDGVVVSARCRELPEGYWLVLKPRPASVDKPYVRLLIAYDHGTRSRQLGQLVLEAWVGPKPTKAHQAAHRNGVPGDDRLDNLLWALSAEVKLGQIARGTHVHGSRHHSARFEKQQVEAVRRIINEFKVPPTLMARALGMPQVRVRDWMMKKAWNQEKWDGLVNPLTGETRESIPSATNLEIQDAIHALQRGAADSGPG